MANLRGVETLSPWALCAGEGFKLLTLYSLLAGSESWGGGQESVSLTVPNRIIFHFPSFLISHLALDDLFISPSSPSYEPSSGH